jgi:hypothetical protein
MGKNYERPKKEAKKTGAPHRRHPLADGLPLGWRVSRAMERWFGDPAGRLGFRAILPA